jgi:hypothetical protein
VVRVDERQQVGVRFTHVGSRELQSHPGPHRQ